MSIHSYYPNEQRLKKTVDRMKVALRSVKATSAPVTPPRA
jgi:hypothetical protein